MVKLANRLDEIGLNKEADFIDKVIIKKFSSIGDFVSPDEFYLSDETLEGSMSGKDKATLNKLLSCRSEISGLMEKDPYGDLSIKLKEIVNKINDSIEHLKQSTFENKRVSPYGKSIELAGKDLFFSGDESYGAPKERTKYKPDGLSRRESDKRDWLKFMEEEEEERRMRREDI